MEVNEDEKVKWELRTVVITSAGSHLIEEEASLVSTNRFTIGLVTGQGGMWRQMMKFREVRFGGNISAHFRHPRRRTHIWQHHGVRPLSDLFEASWHQPFEAHGYVDALNFARLHFNRPIRKWWPHHVPPPKDQGPLYERAEMVKLVENISEELMHSDAAGTTDCAEALPRGLISVAWHTTWAEQAPDLFAWVEGLARTDLRFSDRHDLLLYGVMDPRPL